MARVNLDNHGSWPSEDFIGFGVSTHWLPDEYGHDEEADFSKATHVIAHWDPDDLDLRKKKWLAAGVECTRDIIVLRVSEGARDSIEQLEHGKPWTKTEDGKRWSVLLINCRNHRMLGVPNVIATFYSMKPEEAQAIIEGQVSAGFPDVLRSLFERPAMPLEILPAFSILCQGYLAVQCGPGPGSEDGFKVEVDDPTGAIHTALKDMKWGKALKSSNAADYLDQRLMVVDPAGRDVMRGEVSRASYWSVFAQKDTQELLEAAAREWKGNSGSDVSRESKTAELIRAIPAPFKAENFSLLVAEAFQEMRKLLGGEKYV